MRAGGYLIDTHVLLWDLAADSRISAAQDKILSSDEPKFVSIATIWEIAIKSGIGKLKMPPRLLETIMESDVDLLPIEPSHALRVADLPGHHSDPFDRLLVAQAQIEGLTILTADRRIGLYDVLVV